jgi:ketosteroid isomerase-like protein
LEARDRATISLADRNPSQHEQETEMSESYSLATEPEGVVASLLERFNSGKVSAMMTLYEPEAVFIARDGRTVTDHTEIAAELERDISLGLPLEAKARHVFVAGDIAQIVLDWSIDGTGPDGEHVHLEGSASDIVRRGADGLWRYLIDNPFGTAVRQPV